MLLLSLVAVLVAIGKECEGGVYDVKDGIQFASSPNYTDSAPQIDPNGYVVFCSCIGELPQVPQCCNMPYTPVLMPSGCLALCA